MNVYSIFSIATTVLSFVFFLGIVAWAYSRGRRKAFDEAANAPFALPDDTLGAAPPSQGAHCSTAGGSAATELPNEAARVGAHP